MIENRITVSESLEPFDTRGAEPGWFGNDLTADPVGPRGKRILIVDDEEPLRACLRTMLELEGHQVTEASNGAKAWSLFSTGEFDLVITDFQMPVMEGNKLAIGIKLLAPSLPILMVTASEKARCNVENPVDALLKKPFTVTELRCAVAKLFSATSGPAQPDPVSALEDPSVAFAADQLLIAHVPA